MNALETPEQQAAYARWQQLRGLMLTDPAAAQALLASWGDQVKLPIFVEANIHGGEREGTDAMMQVIRDLVTLPYGTNDAVDELLDHALVVVIPTTNPDGRVAGRRQNENRFDLNRDLLVQSQPEIRANTAFQLQWLAPVGLFMHGYYNPTLVDGLTKPHNPGLEYDKFLYWNQRRLDANQAAIEAIGRSIQRPVNQWDARGVSGSKNGGPEVAEGWDDWGPFYSQTYGAFFGVDGSTVEMCDNAACGGRLGSKREQYLVFYSSARFWLENRNAILDDQLEIFRRGVTGAARVNCCDDPLVAGRGFTESQHNWMVEYPKAFVIPFVGGTADQVSPHRGAQRSDAEANRLVEWLLHNGVQVGRTQADVVWAGTTFPAGSYVVSMRQAFRGFAYTALTAGQDISERISQLYAPPGAWSHGSLWGADVVEIPADDASFNPATTPATDVNELQGGVRSGPADWYALTVKGTAELRTVLDVLRSGVDGEVAEAAFTSVSAGSMPAGSVIFPDDAATVVALEAAGKAAGVFFERGLGMTPAGTQLDEAPRIAILVDSGSPGRVRHVLVAAPDLRPRRGLRLDHERVELAAERGHRPAGEFRRHLQRRPDLSAGQHRAGPPACVLRARRRLHRDQPVRVQLRLPGRGASGADQGQPDAGERRRRRRNRTLGERRGGQSAHGRLPGDRQPLPAVERDVVRVSAHRRRGGRAVPGERRLDLRRRPLA